MAREWQELTALTGGQPLVVERVRVSASDIALDGSFELPALARLSGEDQVFVVAFLRSHGSIKEMERLFGISYPTVKGRLNRISEQLEFVETPTRPAAGEVLSRLDRGEIGVQEALRLMQPGLGKEKS